MANEVFEAGTPDNVRYGELTSRVVDAGWLGVTRGLGINGTIFVSLFFPTTGPSNMGVDTVIAELDLRADDGSLADGFTVSSDRLASDPGVQIDSGIGVYIDYSGPYNERLVTTLEAMADMPNRATDDLLS